MTRAIRSLAPLGLVLVLAVALVGCRTGAERSNYDAAAHERAVAAKSQALSLMASSAEAFSRHSANVDAVNAELEEGYRLAAAAPDNAAVTAEWAAMKDPGRDLYGGFVRLWQSGGTVDQATRDAAMNRVTAGFNYVLCLEAAKKTTKGGICVSPAAPLPEAVETAEPPA
jgi:hypothetical protein